MMVSCEALYQGYLKIKEKYSQLDWYGEKKEARQGPLIQKLS